MSGVRTINFQRRR